MDPIWRSVTRVVTSGCHVQYQLDKKVSTPDPIPYISDSLSRASRKERKYLLVASAISLLFFFAGLVPKEISFFGIKFAELNQGYLVYILAPIILYFFFSFLFHGFADILIWSKHKHNYDCAIHSEPDDWDQDKNWSVMDEQYERTPASQLLNKMIPVMADARVAFDFLFPLLIGIFSILVLFCRGSHW